MSAELLVLLGQLLGIAVAAGLNLYATVAVLGLASRFGTVIELPPELKGLEHGLLIGTAAALYLVEFLLDRMPHLGALWDTIHTVIRPAAAALLTIGILATLSGASVVAGATLAAFIALAVHGSKTGLRLTEYAETHPGTMRLVSLGEDVGAVAIAALALAFPGSAMLVAALSVVVALVAGPRLWRAFILWLRALRARLRGFFGARGWCGRESLPRGLRQLVPPPSLGAAPPRAMRAAVTGLHGVSPYTCGWLVVSQDGHRFVYQTLFAAQQRPLASCRAPSVRHGLWFDAVRLENDAIEYTLFLLKDGPAPELAVAELVAASR
jgi:hypothetical protein